MDVRLADLGRHSEIPCILCPLPRLDPARSPQGSAHDPLVDCQCIIYGAQNPPYGPDAVAWLRPHVLRKSLTFLGIDEPDALIRKLPSRQDRNSLKTFRHTPVAVKLFEELLPTTDTRGHGVQTVWISATMTSILRSYVIHRRWARRPTDGGVFMHGEGPVEAEDTMNAHHTAAAAALDICLVVDPLTGQTTGLEPAPPAHVSSSLTDSQESIDKSIPPLPPVIQDQVKTTVAPGEVHPYLIEALALHWASNHSAMTSDGSSSSTPPSQDQAAAGAFEEQGNSIVIPPPGTSISKFQASLGQLGCPSTSLDVDSLQTARDITHALSQGSSPSSSASTGFKGGHYEDQLLIVPQVNMRGLDIPNVRTVYVLEPETTQQQVSSTYMMEKMDDYKHAKGRMGRLSGLMASAAAAGKSDSLGYSNRPNKMITLVVKGEGEERMRRLFTKMGMMPEVQPQPSFETQSPVDEATMVDHS